jgi:hypothetical protein
LILAGIVALFIFPSFASPAEITQPLRGTIQIVHEKYCKEGSGYAFILKVRVRLTNTTNKKLIVATGLFYYGFAVARDLEPLSKGIYEYHPHINRTIEYSSEPDTNEPGSSFAILRPGESTQTDVDFWGNVSLDDHHAPPGSLSPGNHVLQFWISLWIYRTNPDIYRKNWERFGTLVDSTIATDPFPTLFPPNPKLSSCK